MQKKIKKIDVNNIEEIIDELKANGVPFLMETTTMTRKIITDDFIFSWVNRRASLNMRELNLIKAVKNDAQLIDLDKIPNATASDVQYIYKSPLKMGDVIEGGDIYEIDLNQAYWNMALINGIISEKTFLKADDPRISKSARLIALGALAKQVVTIEFDGDKFGRAIKGAPLPTARCFYHCCGEVSYLMYLLSATAKEQHDGFLFWWIDAIFLRGDFVHVVERELIKIHRDFCVNFPILKNRPFFKMIKIDKIERRKNMFLVFSQQSKKYCRPFTFDKKTKKPILYDRN